MIKGACHCGQVTWEFDGTPEKLVDCNCSSCRRIGALWAHAPLERIRITAAEPTLAYSHGEKSLAFHSCANCGNTTHWAPIEPQEGTPYMAVNMRMADPADLTKLRIRRFDGANTWTFLD